MKKKLMLLLFLLAATLLCLVACNGKNNYEELTKVVFELEGGDYKNCTLPVVHYYDVKEGEERTIFEMTSLRAGDEKKFTRSGYVFVGWYKTKSATGEYSNPWNFETDKITSEGVTLYAKWEKAIKYTFNLCYWDNKEQAQVYDVEEGQTFPTYFADSDVERAGYTFWEYVDENGDPWDMSYAHPGGETDLAINVYAKYLVGEFVLVSKASDLANVPLDKGVYLMNDIDMKGATLNLYKFTNATFQGNGYTISNFKVGYKTIDALIKDFNDEDKKALSISIFGVLDGATIENVTFDNFSVDVYYFNNNANYIYLSLLSGKITNSTINKVTLKNFSYTVTDLPMGDFDPETDFIVTLDKAAYIMDSSNTITDLIVSAQPEVEQ